MIINEITNLDYRIEYDPHSGYFFITNGLDKLGDYVSYEDAENALNNLYDNPGLVIKDNDEDNKVVTKNDNKDQWVVGKYDTDPNNHNVYLFLSTDKNDANKFVKFIDGDGLYRSFRSTLNKYPIVSYSSKDEAQKVVNKFNADIRKINGPDPDDKDNRDKRKQKKDINKVLISPNWTVLKKWW